jgi:hypothetical protein
MSPVHLIDRRLVFAPLRLARWPLRRIGLEPGQALHNANPSQRQVQVRRAEQRARVVERFGTRSG